MAMNIAEWNSAMRQERAAMMLFEYPLSPGLTKFINTAMNKDHLTVLTRRSNVFNESFSIGVIYEYPR